MKGSEHDATAFYESEVTVHLETLLTDIPFPSHVDDPENGLHLLKPTIAGDKAYNTLRVPAPWQVICTMTGEPKVSQKKQTARQKRKMVREDSDEGDNERTPDRTEKHGKIIFITGIAKWRTQVERTFGLLKSFKLLGLCTCTMPRPVVCSAVCTGKITGIILGIL